MSDLNQQPPADRSVKITHLVFGLLFLGVAVVWALVVGDVINENDLAVHRAGNPDRGRRDRARDQPGQRPQPQEPQRTAVRPPVDAPSRPVDQPVDDQTDHPTEYPAESPLDDHTKEIR